jgi:cell division protein FtsL
MVVLIVLIACAAGVITGVAKEVRKYLCHREEVELKRDLLASGMNAAEIEQVVRARSRSGGSNSDSHSNMTA